ncbi:hypothetical protein SAMN04487857_12816 [Pseudomonas sp. ok272]|uniref:hypothetical protein n=1 Tax=unclassified Pseudomonas TaxID=196821 RepID=UPI0008B3B9F2|nr:MULTISPECIES: hypothetical protein [unclassified Pseudomonas]SEN63738.1 hypothetical protein SAMN04487857_12816 [Pseudomonas sp. ok272]SFN42800.1 hypothetical protein SAMN04487858_12816 [Pseudomonas sp. ok602]
MHTPSSEPDQLARSQAYLHRVFADRPSLADVANDVIQQALDERFAPHTWRAGRLGIGQIAELAAEGGAVTYHQVMPLAEALIARVMQGSAVNYTPGHHVVLSIAGRSPVPLGAGLTVDDLEQLINQLAPVLLGQFQARLADYWSETPGAIDPLSTRWRIVSEQLSRCLRHARQSPPLQRLEEQQMLANLYALKADRDRTAGPNRFRVFLIYAISGARAGEWLSVLVIQRQWAARSQSYVYSPGASLLSLDSLNDLDALLPRYMSRWHPGESIRWALHEPEEDVFDRLAQSLLEKQLRDLADICWSSFPSVAYYQQLCADLTAPDRWFASGAGLTQDSLPVWLQTASPQARQRYSQGLDGLARVQRDAAGASYLDGLEPINVYTRNALQAQMAKDHPREVLIDPDHYALRFTRTQGGTVSWTQTTQRTLTEWALDNPFASPYARVEIINLAEPGYVPTWWINVAYLKSLIERVDIGQRYPALLKAQLLDDEPQVQRRQHLFCAQARAQLPLLALENTLRQRHGFTSAGFKVIQALLAPEGAGQANIVARPLAFLTHAGGRVHVAHNLFVIGAADVATSPHVLYRPAGPEVLQQFASRQTLLDTLARSGTPLNEAVLNSLDETGRALFGNGGFLSPHVQRHLPGDEFGPIAGSSPALLSDRQVEGDFLAQVFREHAQALVAQAQQQAHSTDAQRWAGFGHDLWQLFSATLPLLRGPLAAAGWLLQLMHSAQAWVSLPQEADEATRAEATATFLAELAGVLLHHVATLDERLGLAHVKPWTRATRPRLLPAPTITRQSTAPLLSVAPLADVSPMSTPSWSSARSQLSPGRHAELLSFRWQAHSAVAFQPQPATPEFIETQGVTKGLYRVYSSAQRFHLHALIDGELYPVSALDGGYRVIDLTPATRLGPWVTRDGDGHWSFDFRLRLVGGMPRKNTLPSRTDLLRRNLDLADQYARSLATLLKADEQVNTAFTYYHRMHVSKKQTFTDQHRHTIHLRYQEQLHAQAQAQVQRIEAFKRKNENQPMARFEAELIEQLEDHVDNLRRQMALRVLERSAARPSAATTERWYVALESADEQVSAQAHQESIESLRTLAGLNEQLLELSLKERGRLEELASMVGYNPSTRSLSDSASANWTPLDWRVKQVEVLQGLVLRRRPLPEEYADFVATKQALDVLVREVISHKNLLAAEELARGTRIELLGNVLDQYAVIQDRLDFMGQAYPELFEAHYLDQLTMLIVDVQVEAQHAQALLLKEQAREPQPEPPARRVSGSRQRLIVTRDKQVLRGRVRESTPDSDEEIVDVQDPIDQQPLGAFKQNPQGGEWEEIPRPPRAHAPLRGVKSLLGDADSLLGRVDRAISQARKTAQKSNSPISVEAELTRVAEGLREHAKKIQQAVEQREHGGGAGRSERERSLLHSLEQAASDLVEEGRQLRIDIIKHNPPQATRIDYLKAQAQIDIVKIEGRVKLRRDHDYLQEYLIRDTERRPLAYAHFHYRGAEDAPAQFTAGHLKLPEQRYVSFVPVEGQSEQRMLRAYRGDIGSRLAQALFFGVEQTIARQGRQAYW